MAGSSVVRALKRSAMSAARRVPKRAAADATLSDHVLRAREDFTYFCSAMGKPPAAHMLEWHKEFVTGESNDFLLDLTGPNTCLLSPRGPLHVETPVATPDGWRPLNDIRRGSMVYASDGTPVRVKDKRFYGKAKCFEVLFSDGTSLTCDDSHRFVVKKAIPGSPWRETTLERLRTLVREYDGKPRPGSQMTTRRAGPGERPWLDSRGAPRWEVPVCAAVQREELELPIEPYTLGILLARGHLSDTAVRFTTGDLDVIERVKEEIPDDCMLSVVDGSTGIWSIRGRPREATRSRTTVKPRNSLRALLGEMGLWPSQYWSRRVPGEYLNSSIAQRLALLQGLLDAAGQPRRGGTALFRARSQEMADDVLELARSLGAYAWEAPVQVYRSRAAHTVVIALPEETAPFHSQAKSEAYERRLATSCHQRLRRTIVDIRPAGRLPIACLEVEHPEHDFLVQDYVVSCNSAKSTEVGLLCAWTIGRHALAHRLLRVLYVSYNVDVSRGKSQAIKQTILSSEYQEIFPMVRLSKTRTADELWAIDYEFAEIDVRGEDAFTLACAGLRGSITSKRSNLVVLDDLIKSEKDIANPEARREMEKNWNAVIVPTMFQGARAIALGTRFHFDDMFATTFIERNGWKVITQQALHYDDEGRISSYWPEMWDVSYLLERRDADRVAFAYQYMNQPVRSTELGVSPELFIKGEIPDEFDQIGVGVDLSSGTRERNDYTVFMLGGRIGDKAYIIDKRRVRCMGNIEKVEALAELLCEWNLVTVDERGRYQPTFSEVTIWPEIVAYQKSFEGDLKRILYNEWGLTNVRVSPVKGIRGDKLARFRGVMGLFETRKVVFNKYRDFQVVFDEVMNLGHAPHDDCADALQILLMRLFQRGQAQVEWA